MPPTRTARQPPVVGAAPLATYSRQVPFVPCEYSTDPNTLCLYEGSREKKLELQTFIWGLFLIPAQISPNGLRYGRLAHRI